MRAPKKNPAGGAGLALQNVPVAMEGRKTADTAPSKALDGASSNARHCGVRNVRGRAPRVRFAVLRSGFSFWFRVLTTRSQWGRGGASLVVETECVERAVLRADIHLSRAAPQRSEEHT